MGCVAMAKRGYFVLLVVLWYLRAFFGRYTRLLYSRADKLLLLTKVSTKTVNVVTGFDRFVVCGTAAGGHEVQHFE
jgi:hypothetical protein